MFAYLLMSLCPSHNFKHLWAWGGFFPVKKGQEGAFQSVNCFIFHGLVSLFSLPSQLIAIEMPTFWANCKLLRKYLRTEEKCSEKGKLMSTVPMSPRSNQVRRPVGKHLHKARFRMQMHAVDLDLWTTRFTGASLAFPIHTECGWVAHFFSLFFFYFFL